MNPFSNGGQSEEDQQNDLPLSLFLRQNKPIAPPASPDLEDCLLAAIAQSPCQPIELPQRPRRSEKRRLVWMVPAIAAGLVAALVSHRTFVPVASKPAQTPLETAELEAFIETTWHDPVADSASDPANTDLFVPAKDTRVN